VSTIHGAHHVKRGYENIERKFADLGARIARLEEGNDSTNS
jgi:UDP-N-acetylglucosamine enolpyruvyl transferase